ncbi:hypothetical protein ACFL0H_00100 [Thermodesulfobacteriota bacterium]
MKPIFTIHAGEYLVGSYIEENYKELNVWIPSKDTGIDLLVTDSINSTTVSLQVKFSKDFLITHGKKEYQSKFLSWGWWTFNREKIRASPADYWVMVMHTFNDKNMHYVIIEPKELSRRMNVIHPTAKSLQTYLWVTSSKKCWETRGLKKKDQVLVANDLYSNKDRDFSGYLNNWHPIEEKFKIS